MGLNDFIADPMAQRILPPQGSIGGGGFQRGPTAAPITQNPQALNAQDALNALLRMLERLPDAFATTFRTKFPTPPRESVPIYRSAADVEVAANAAQNVVQFTVPSKYNGFITNIGFNVVGAGSFDDIAWSVLIDNMPHPSFSELQVFANNLATPYPFQFEVIQGRTLTLRARNSSGAPIDVSGVLIGWMELMTEAKPYGTMAWSGIG